MFIAETALRKDASVVDKLRLNLIQSIAMVRLLFRKWCEPADKRHYHFSHLYIKY